MTQLLLLYYNTSKWKEGIYAVLDEEAYVSYHRDNNTWKTQHGTFKAVFHEFKQRGIALRHDIYEEEYRRRMTINQNIRKRWEGTNLKMNGD